MILDNKEKHILLIIFPFYEYHTRIAKELENLGYHVDTLLNQFSLSYVFSFNKILFILRYLLRKIPKEDVSEYIEKEYDIVLAIGGYTFSKTFIDKLKYKNCNLRTIIFFWDSFKYWNNSYVIDWFDEKYSFDVLDCIKYKNKGLLHLPDFYLGEEINISSKNDIKYDICFIGSLNIFSVNRLFFLKKFTKLAKDNALKAFIFLYYPRSNKVLKEFIHCITSFRHFLYNICFFLFRDQKFISSEKLSLSKVKEIESCSKCIIDIPIKKQTGTTIRVLEALAAGKKVITTNRYVKNEKFYDPRNVLILNRKKDKEILNFINSEKTQNDISYLKIGNWLKTLLG